MTNDRSRKSKKPIRTFLIAALLVFSLLVHGCGRNTGSEQTPPNAPSEISYDTAQTDSRSTLEAGTAPYKNSTQKTTDTPTTQLPEMTDSASHSSFDIFETANASTAPNAALSGTEKNHSTDSSVSQQTNGTPAFSQSGALRVNGTTLTDSTGTPIQLRGISTHGLAWFPDYVNADCFRQLRDEWNVNAIRLAMYTAEYGGYCSDGNKEQLKKLIRDGVDYATAAGMYVIIDWHILSDGNPLTHKEESKAFFAEMAELYADHNNVLYEICNEPNGGTDWSDIKAYAKEVISVIRSFDKDGIVLVGTPNWSQYVDQAAADPITEYDNIMYTLHFYAATHTDSLRNTMTAAIDAGLPIFVSEFGICDASGNGAINEEQANRWIDTMDKYHVSYIAWNLSNKAETSAMLSTGCSKTSGFTEKDLSASGKWLYQMLTGKSTSTLPADSALAAASGTETVSASESISVQKPAVSGTCSFTARLINSWESDQKVFYQYDLAVLNPSDSDCSQWSVHVTFSDSIALSDGWNGNYTVDGNILHITGKDYNSYISSGGSAENIGFIISSGSGLQILE